MDEVITVTLRPALYATVREKARREGRPIIDVARSLILAGLDSEGRYS